MPAGPGGGRPGRGSRRSRGRREGLVVARRRREATRLDLLVAAIAEVYHDGLDPADYHIEALQSYRSELRGGTPLPPNEQADLEVLATDATMLALSHLYLGKVDPVRFSETFGAGREQLGLLVENQTVTIAKLMEIAPAGTIDPTSTLYNTTMYLMAALLGVALVCNAMMRPVHEKHHM